MLRGCTKRDMHACGGGRLLGNQPGAFTWAANGVAATAQVPPDPGRSIAAFGAADVGPTKTTHRSARAAVPLQVRCRADRAHAPTTQAQPAHLHNSHRRGVGTKRCAPHPDAAWLSSVRKQCLGGPNMPPLTTQQRTPASTGLSCGAANAHCPRSLFGAAAISI